MTKSGQPEIVLPVLRLLVGMPDPETGETMHSIRIAADGNFDTVPDRIEPWMLEVLTVAITAVGSAKEKVEAAILLRQVVDGRERRKMQSKLKAEQEKLSALEAEALGKKGN